MKKDRSKKTCCLLDIFIAIDNYILFEQCFSNWKLKRTTLFTTKFKIKKSIFDQFWSYIQYKPLY